MRANASKGEKRIVMIPRRPRWCSWSSQMPTYTNDKGFEAPPEAGIPRIQVLGKEEYGSTWNTSRVMNTSMSHQTERDRSTWKD